MATKSDIVGGVGTENLEDLVPVSSGLEQSWSENEVLRSSLEAKGVSNTFQRQLVIADVIREIFIVCK